jgi:hypothetical protein
MGFEKEWKLHWLSSGGDLSSWRDGIISECDAAHNALSSVLRPLPLDILITRNNAVISEIGMGGRAFRSNLLEIRLDPENINFEYQIQNGALRRTFVHEAHHCMRMGGPGYGRTLGEALVSEGLSGQFVQHLFNTPPEPWESAFGESFLAENMPQDKLLWLTPYDHAGWFFGAGGRHPRWLGYSLGFWLVGKWLAEHEPTAEEWVAVSARAVIEAAFKQGF